jgi:hypothetical protein
MSTTNTTPKDIGSRSLALGFSFLALAAAAQPSATKFVAFGWEFSRKSVRDLVAVVDSLDKTPLDGIGVYLNEPNPEGGMVSTHNIMREPWDRKVLEPLVPTARELTAHRSMKECFIGTFRAPAGKRIEWDDDAGWANVASNMAIAAWFAREGGFRGISMDPEDYHGTAQFQRRSDDPPYDEMVALARRRGREVFSGVFREFPEIRILSFWFLSMNLEAFGADDPARDARENGVLWPAFVDGILDVMPPTARIIDGCEHSYRYESFRGDFFRAGDVIRRRLPALLSPENRAKYAAQVGASFGIYLDMFTNPEGSSWYFGPVDGSRLLHFERNLFQAAEAADGYVWLWGEKHSWGDWGEKGADADRGISPETWDAALPGLADAILAVKDPVAFAKKRVAALEVAGTRKPLNDNPDCRSENGEVPAPYEVWQNKKSRQGRLWGDSTCGEGDTYSLAVEGAENGAFSFPITQKLSIGDRLYVTVSMKGDGGKATFAWRRGAAWDWNVLPPIRIPFGEPDADGWRHANAVIRVPEGFDGCGLILAVRQAPGQICHFDNVAIYKLAW